jgi:hypothetical protein
LSGGLDRLDCEDPAVDVNGVKRYREMPRTGGVSYAARFDDPENLEDVLAVARKKQSDARVAFVPGLDVLLVKTDDDRGEPDYDVVERGHLLVYSDPFGVLYTTNPSDFERDHEPLP